jgi:HSP20 family protein
MGRHTKRLRSAGPVSIANRCGHHWPLLEVYMSLIRWEPFREIDDLFRQYSPLFNRSLRSADEGVRQWSPSANISETEKEYLIKAELPEVRKEDVKITLDDGVITISGERKFEKEDKDERAIRVESFYGTFERRFSLPENVDTDAISADSKDGVLRIRIPKQAAAKPKTLTIPVQ